MRARVLLLVLLVLIVLLLPTNIWRWGRPKPDTTAVVEEEPPAPEYVLVAGGQPLTFTFDSLPPEVMTAVKARYPEFVPHNPREMPERTRATYRASPDDGLAVVRANFASAEPAYAVAGIQGQSQLVVGVVRDQHGWTARSISSTGTPPFSPWVTVSKRRRGHPNGRWDAIIVRVFDPGGAYDEVYWFNPTDRRFYLGAGAR